MNVTGKLCQLRQALRSCRNLHVTSLARCAAAYEGPGKTTVTFISKEIGPRILVQKCDEVGFTLNNDKMIIGPTILFPRLGLCWNIESGEHINDSTLSLLFILEPKPDLVIIGLEKQYTFSHIRYIQELMCKHKIAVEVMSVVKACTVFNFANEDGRYVVAALIPQNAPEQLRLLSTDTKGETDPDDSEKKKANSLRKDTKLE
ncbi:NADH dehydrogenase [ubiquinone] 1 alpha subcomplex assembly factor 3 [Harpegnathos saltator]|uniref:Uncharacterized protein C3orf60-like protein n=1 Tax=Harpegnathos saltator TaxID=610380 RepID=E2C9C6_HARSA|nr:NADH dehydrogenase [ubiquinone] 1 alpha subcomplex assembly factor 3 [Harpegnathos saltator]EFN75471.1 Uncharacterized protein C3orf60-like protein [Harpegnathos saltator]